MIKITDCMVAKLIFHESYLHRGTRHPERRRREKYKTVRISQLVGQSTRQKITRAIRGRWGGKGRIDSPRERK